MKVVFRVDASIDIGVGHVMRCLSLAHGLRRRGARCTFICRDHVGNLIDAIVRQDFEVHSLAASRCGTETIGYEAWFGSPWDADAQDTLACMGDAPVDWMVLDHYGADARWEHRIAARCRQILVIDDLMNRHHACAVLLDQNLGRTATGYAELVPSSCKVIAGPMYALLRDEFAELRSRSLQRRARPELEQVLVSLGGIDKENVTSEVLRALREARLPAGLRVKIVMGSNAPWLGPVRKYASECGLQAEVLVNIGDMAVRMAESDLAIGAAGSTSWERCVMGLPSLVVPIAENQRHIARALADAGAARSVELAELGPVLTQFFGDPHMSDVLATMSASARKISDGRGVERVSGMMMEGCAQ